MAIQKLANITIIVVAVIFFLIIAQSILVPLILGIFSWFLIKGIRDFVDKSAWIKAKVPRWTKTIFASILLLIIIGVFSNLLLKNAQTLANSLQKYNANLDMISATITNYTGFDIGNITTAFAGEINFQSVVSELLNSITGLLSNSIMVLLYLIFILMEESTFLIKMNALYPEKNKFQNINDVLIKIDKSIARYISIKTFLSFLTGSISYIILLLIGIESALFFAFIIFTLNFVPSIGSLVATLFPALMALLQFGNETFTPFFMVIIFIGAVQVLIGNFLEPKLMGNSLNISSLVVILSLTVWGAIWGVAGMVLSVPITVILIIVFANFKSTKNIAILLSEKGVI